MSETKPERAGPVDAWTLMRRAASLMCPRCGRGKLFSGWFSMHRHCLHCDLKFERAPGYFLGSAYVGYGVLCLTITPAYVVLHFAYGIPNEWLTFPILTYIVVVGAMMFHYGRAWWLAMDCRFDATDFQLERDESRPPEESPRSDSR